MKQFNGLGAAQEAAKRTAGERLPIGAYVCQVKNVQYVNGEKGWCPARKVEVRDTTGAGDAFCAGAVIGMTHGKSMAEACKIGTTLSASVITTSESVCPRFQPRELGLDIDVVD